MNTDEWKVLDIRNKLRHGMLMSVHMIPVQVVLLAILIPALINHEPLTVQEAGVAAGCIVLNYRLTLRIRRLYRFLDEVQAKQMARRAAIKARKKS